MTLPERVLKLYHGSLGLLWCSLAIGLVALGNLCELFHMTALRRSSHHVVRLDDINTRVSVRRCRDNVRRFKEEAP